MRLFIQSCADILFGERVMPGSGRQVPATVAVLIVATVWLCLPISNVAGQEFRGSLIVDVVDSSGGAIPSAQVTVGQDKSAPPRSQSTNARGKTHSPAPPPPTFCTRAAARCFSPKTRAVVAPTGAKAV